VESFKYVLQMHFPASNNEANYEALLHGLRVAIALRIRWNRVLRDSLFIVNQGQQRVVMFRQQNDDVLPEALQARKQFRRSQVPTHFMREE
jgi:ribonuclease HI